MSWIHASMILLKKDIALTLPCIVFEIIKRWVYAKDTVPESLTSKKSVKTVEISQKKQRTKNEISDQ